MDDIITWLSDRTGSLAILGTSVTTLIVFFKRIRLWTKEFTDMPHVIKANSRQLGGIDIRTRRTEEIVWMRDRADEGPIYWVDSNGRDITRVNSAFATLMGLTEKDLLDNQGTSYVVEADKKRVDEGWARAVETGTTFECTFEHMNAGKIHAKTQPILLGCGKVGGWIGEIHKVD